MKRKTHTDGTGARLRSFIEFRGRSIREFADEAHIPYRTLIDYLAGKRRPGVEHLVRLDAVGLDLTWLLTGRMGSGIGSVIAKYDAGVDDSVVGADERFLELLKRQAFSEADAYVERRLARGAGALTTYQGMLVFSYYLSRMIRVAARMAEAIANSRAVFEDNTVVKLAAASLSPDLDANIDQLLDAVTQVPLPE